MQFMLVGMPTILQIRLDVGHAQVQTNLVLDVVLEKAPSSGLVVPPTLASGETAPLRKAIPLMKSEGGLGQMEPLLDWVPAPTTVRDDSGAPTGEGEFPPFTPIPPACTFEEKAMLQQVEMNPAHTVAPKTPPLSFTSVLRTKQTLSRGSS